MTVAIFLRTAVAGALIAGSALSFPVAAQSSYDDSSGQSPTPKSSERDSGASDRSRDQGTTPADSQGSNIRSGTDTGQDRTMPGAGDSGRGGPSNAPNCPTMPPNAAECPPQGK